MRILTASDRALLVETADLDEAMRLNLAWAGVRGVIERIPGARTVLVRFDPLQVSAGELAATLAATKVDAAHSPTVREVTVPVRYDGEDLEDAAAALGVSAEALVARHLAADWRVAFSGFAPGFGYAVSDDALFDVPRRSSPRTRVPAGAVALAGQFTGVYPRESPGGWQLIGQTDAVMWDIDRDPPALMAPGASVTFERAAREVVAASDRAHRSLREERSGETTRTARAVEVVQASLRLLVQDAGRAGHAALGVSASGAADRTAMRAANRAVGNHPGAAVLESVGGGVLRFHGTGVAVVTGAVGEFMVSGRSASGDSGSNDNGSNDSATGRAVAHGVPFAVADGDELRLGFPAHGLRYVIGVRGGVAAASALGSRSSDTLAGLGPAPLSSGDVVAVGDAAVAAVDPVAIVRALPAPGDLVELQITLGPRDEWFTASALETLTSQEWEVTSRSDRVGIRLQGDVPLERAVLAELPSEGAVAGAIQVPADGQPVLFGADHPLTGGYPIIAALTDRFLDLAAQLPPGARVRFRIR